LSASHFGSQSKDDTRLLRKEQDRSTAEQQNLSEKLWDVNMIIEKTEQQTKKANVEKQDLMVDENIIKLEIRRLRNVLNQRLTM
jgi:UDP-glucose:O-linked fucose beta-1,3-glucosyltransferase